MTAAGGRVGETPVGEARPRIVPVAALPRETAEQVYQRILVPAFRPEEIPGLADYLQAYAGAAADPSGVLLRDDEPVGVYLCSAYVDGQVVLLSHLAVSAEARGGGIGSLLMEHLTGELGRTWPGAVLLGEADDPRAWPGTAATGDPVARLMFYARHGAELLPLAWMQPRLQPDAERVRGMFLFRLDRGRDSADGLLPRFVAEYVTQAEGTEALEDPEVQGLLASTAAVDIDHDLLPMADWRRVASGSGSGA